MQPLFNQDGSLAIVYNGEVYEYEALRRQLEARGHRFNTPSDTEVVLHLYEEHGVECTRYLNGEYAFAIWDGQRRELVAVRDPFGVKPLFYGQHRGSWVFASEAKALLALEGMVPQLDPAWFVGPGAGLANTRVSPFRGITALRPGHLIRVARGATPVQIPWWTRPIGKESNLSLEDAAQAVREAVTRAVERRVGGEVPIALALSSGVDSTAVAALAARLRPGRRVFTLSYPGAAYDEGAQAVRSAGFLGLEFEPVTPSCSELGERFMASIWSTEVVTNSLSTAGRIALTAAVRRAGFKALCGGEAADEVFGGYPFFQAEAIARLRASPDAAVRQAGEQAWRGFCRRERASRGVFWDSGLGREDATLFGYPSAYERRLRRLSRFAGLLLSPLLDQSTARATAWEAAREEFDLSAHRALRPFDSSRLVMRSIFASLITAALGDRVEMANSLEGRVPFLDRHVVELAYSLPEHFCVSAEQRKLVVRRAFTEVLPPHFVPLPKHTWMAPTFAELAHTAPGRELFETLLSKPALARAELLDRNFVRVLLAAWKWLPRKSARFVALDGIIGYCLSVQALHHVFVERAERFAVGARLELENRTPVPSRLEDPERHGAARNRTV